MAVVRLIKKLRARVLTKPMSLERPDKSGQVYKPLEPLDRRIALWRTVIEDPRQIAIYDRVAAQVDRESYAALQEKYRHDIDPEQQRAVTKYLDLAPWFMIHSRLATLLDIDTRPPCSILDIGSGGGQFLAIAKAYGHAVTGMDMPKPQLYADLLELFGIERIEGGIALGKSLPGDVGKYDMIVINGQVFDVHGRDRRRWRLPKWKAFIDYLCDRHLNYPGTFFLGLNKSFGPGSNEFYWPMVDLAEEYGAHVDRQYATMIFNLEEPPDFTKSSSGKWLALDPEDSTSRG